jgi:hypothetical protein
MTFDPSERNLLASLADVLIPAGDDFPSASQAGVADEWLDATVASRPDLGASIKPLLESARGRHAKEFVAALQQADPGAFGVLAELVAGAYFMNPTVRSRLGYHGQTPKPLDPRPDYLDDGLLQSVIDRGPVYRPTPGMNGAPGEQGGTVKQ